MEANLRAKLSKYQYAEVAKNDVLNAFRTYTDLRPNTDFFVFNDGSRRELVCLEGTIPVNYKGNVYNIPLCLWMLEGHPYNPPMVFVKPTATMQIKAGKHVDHSGRVFLPYLHEWKHPQSDLLGLLQILGIVFGEEPPVFSKATPPPRPPYPPGNTGAANPPYPAAGGGYMPMPTIQGASNPGYPSYPPSTAGGYQPPTSSYQPPTSSAGYNPGSYGGGYPPAQGYQGQQGYPPAAGYPPASGYPAASYAGQQYQTQASTTGSTAGQHHTPLVTSSSLALSDDQIKASLLSAVEDKMRRRLREIFAQAQAEMDALKRTQDDLIKGKQKLETMVTNMEKEQNAVERNIAMLKEKDVEIKEVLRKMENREEVNIDDAVVPTAPLYKQLLNAFAEEQATEDAIYYLGEGLRRGVVDLAVFLKKVRELSRNQFMLRALIHRCRQKAGLPD